MPLEKELLEEIDLAYARSEEELDLLENIQEDLYPDGKA